MPRLSDEGTLSALADADLIYAVDVSDTTDNAAGTSVAITAANLATTIESIATGDGISNQTIKGWVSAGEYELTTRTVTEHNTNCQWFEVLATVAWPDGSAGGFDGIWDKRALTWAVYVIDHTDSGKIVYQAPLTFDANGRTTNKPALTFITPDYWVDSSGDAGSAGTQADPFNAISDLSALGAGETVALVRGSTWREQLTLPANNITVVAVGAGARPILDGADVVTSWSKTAGRTNVYEKSVTHDATANTWLSAWEDYAGSDTARYKRVADLATCDSTASSIYTADDATSPATVYIHTSGSDAPSGYTIEVSTRKYGLTGFNGGLGVRTGCTIIGIVTRRQTHNNGSLEMGPTSTLVCCAANGGTKHSLYYQDGSTLVGVSATDCYFGTEANTIFVYNQDTPASAGVDHLYCAAVQTSGAPGNIGGGSASTGYHGHINTSGDFGAVTYTDCYATRVVSGWTATAATSMTITRPVTYNCTNHFAPWMTTTITKPLGIVDDSTLTTVRFCSITTFGSITVTITNPDFRMNDGGVSNGAIYCDQTSITLSVTGTSVTERGYYYIRNGGAFFACAAGSTSLNLTIKWMKFEQFEFGRTYDVGAGGTVTSLTADLDHNIIADGTLNVRWQGTDHADFATYSAAESQDTRSRTGCC